MEEKYAVHQDIDTFKDQMEKEYQICHIRNRQSREFIQAKHKENRQQLSRKTREINALKAQMAAIKTEHANLQGNSQKTQLKRSILEKEYQDLQALHKKMVQSNRQQLSNKDQEINALKAQMAAIKTKHEPFKFNAYKPFKKNYSEKNQIHLNN